MFTPNNAIGTLNDNALIISISGRIICTAAMYFNNGTKDGISNQIYLHVYKNGNLMSNINYYLYYRTSVHRFNVIDNAGVGQGDSITFLLNVTNTIYDVYYTFYITKIQ